MASQKGVQWNYDSANRNKLKTERPERHPAPLWLFNRRGVILLERIERSRHCVLLVVQSLTCFGRYTPKMR